MQPAARLQVPPNREYTKDIDVLSYSKYSLLFFKKAEFLCMADWI